MPRPGGQPRFFEHVRSPHRMRGMAQDVLPRYARRWVGGCHLNRDNAGDIRAADVTIDTLDRVVYAPLRFAPPQTHILGRATPPPAPAAG